MKWSGDLAYAIGLIATDGCLSKDGRHIELTSKDLEQIETFERILKTKNKIGTKSSTYSPERRYFRLQFSNVVFYRFLTSLGLHPHKSKTLKKVQIPDSYFADFLRGSLDGDGFTYSYWDKRWKSSFRFYSGFVSASYDYLVWMKERICSLYGISGSLRLSGSGRAYQLVYSKTNSIVLVKKMYYSGTITYLSRKKNKIDVALDIINQQQARVAKLAIRTTLRW